MSYRELRIGFVIVGVLCTAPAILEKFGDVVATFLSQDAMGIFVFPLLFLVLRKFNIV